MKDNCLYFDISRRERDSAIRYLLRAIIKCRDKCQMNSNSNIYDEDVNVYLAHLLFAVSLPDYHDMAEPYLSKDSNEVMRWVNDAEDQTIRYFIFKVNADHILVHTAIFNSLANSKQRHYYSHSHNYYRELAKLYYEQAAAYHKRIYRKRTGVGDVLDKMAYDFQSYQHVLRYVRKEYFHFLNDFKDQAFKTFLQDVDNYEQKTGKKDKMDRFLDLYGKWLETKDRDLETEIVALAEALKEMDPEFNFDVIEKFRNDDGGGYFDEKKCA